MDPAFVAFEGRARLTTIGEMGVAGMPSRPQCSASPGEAPPVRLSGVSVNLLRVLGVQPVLGRDFTEEDVKERRQVALLSHESGTAVSAARTEVITTTIGSAARPGQHHRRAAAGIHTADDLFRRPSLGRPDPRHDPGGWTAIGRTAWWRRRSRACDLMQQWRLLARRSRHWFRDSRRSSETPRGACPLIRVDPVQAALFSRFAANAWLILAAAVVLLLLACANLANLLLARGRSREYDAAIHASLGAGRSRLISHALLESVLVCGAGAAVALAVVSLTAKALGTVLPPLLARYSAGAADSRLLAITILVALACAMAAGLLPAWRASRVDVLSVLQSASASRQRSRLRGGRSLIVVESALAVLLVLSGFLLFRSFANFSTQDLGFDPEGLYTVVPAAAVSQAFVGRRSYRVPQTIDFTRQIAGVRSVGGADSTLVSGAAPMRAISKDRWIKGGRYQISANYFETLATPFIAGRDFTDAEVRARADVAILSHSRANLFRGSSQHASGRQIGDR